VSSWSVSRLLHDWGRGIKILFNVVALRIVNNGVLLFDEVSVLLGFGRYTHVDAVENWGLHKISYESEDWVGPVEDWVDWIF